MQRLQMSMAKYNPDLTQDQIVKILADAENLEVDPEYNEEEAVKDSKFLMSVRSGDPLDNGEQQDPDEGMEITK